MQVIQHIEFDLLKLISLLNFFLQAYVSRSSMRLSFSDKNKYFTILLIIACWKALPMLFYGKTSKVEHLHIAFGTE